MSRNRDFTCDRCGAQFDEDDNGFTLSLGKKEAQRSLDLDGIEGFRYDLCDSCAAYVRRTVKEYLTMHRKASDVQ